MSKSESALERLVPLVYSELHRLARGYMRGERAGHTLQTMALIDEAFLAFSAVTKSANIWPCPWIIRRAKPLARFTR